MDHICVAAPLLVDSIKSGAHNDTVNLGLCEAEGGKLVANLCIIHNQHAIMG